MQPWQTMQHQNSKPSTNLQQAAAAGCTPAALPERTRQRRLLVVVGGPHHRRVHLVHRQVVHHLPRCRGCEQAKEAGGGVYGNKPQAQLAVQQSSCNKPAAHPPIPALDLRCRCSAWPEATACPLTSCSPAVSTSGAALTLTDSSLTGCSSPDEAGPSSPLQRREAAAAAVRAGCTARRRAAAGRWYRAREPLHAAAAPARGSSARATGALQPQVAAASSPAVAC